MTTGSDPGERRMNGTCGGGTMVGENQWGSRPVGAASWPEKFQDLASYCPPPQDELNTPQAKQDEFNFSIDGQGHDCIASPADLAKEPWELSAEVYSTTPFSLEYEMGGDQPLLSSSLSLLPQQEDDKTSKWDQLTLIEGNVSGSIKGQFDDWRRESPIKSNGNLLLTQGVLRTEEQQQKYLSSIVKSEEPFIIPPGGKSLSRAAKLNSSQLFKNENHCSLLVTTLTTASVPKITAPPVAAVKKEPETAILIVKNEKSYLIEEESIDNFKVPQINEICQPKSGNTNSNIAGSVRREHKDRPKLKLNITAANNINLTTLDTPEAFQSLTDEPEFDLLKFVNGEFDEPNVLTDAMDPKSMGAPGMVDAVKSDHDYVGINGRLTEVKSEPVDDEMDDVKMADENDEEEDRNRGLKRRRSSSVMSQEDDDTFDSPADSSEDSQEWSPYKRKTNSSTKNPSKKKSGGSGKTRGSGSGGGKKCRKTSIDSEEGTGPDRYRELRDRNNEASRKSRLNRKQKEIEMVQLAERLEDENKNLKDKAESLERLVKRLREVLMNIVSKKM